MQQHVKKMYATFVHKNSFLEKWCFGGICRPEFKILKNIYFSKAVVNTNKQIQQGKILIKNKSASSKVEIGLLFLP